MKRASLLVSFWVVSIVLVIMIDAGANPYYATNGILPFEASRTATLLCTVEFPSPAGLSSTARLRSKVSLVARS